MLHITHDTVGRLISGFLAVLVVIHLACHLVWTELDSVGDPNSIGMLITTGLLILELALLCEYGYLRLFPQHRRGSVTPDRESVSSSAEATHGCTVSSRTTSTVKVATLGVVVFAGVIVVCVALLLSPIGGPWKDRLIMRTDAEFLVDQRRSFERLGAQALLKDNDTRSLAASGLLCRGLRTEAFAIMLMGPRFRADARLRLKQDLEAEIILGGKHNMGAGFGSLEAYNELLNDMLDVWPDSTAKSRLAEIRRRYGYESLFAPTEKESSGVDSS